MRTRDLLPLAAALLGAACVHVPPAPIDAGLNAQKLERRSLDDPAVAAALAKRDRAPPADGLWGLDDLTIAAWTLRPDVAVAAAQVDAARARVGVEGLRPNPSVDSSVERVTNDTRGESPWVVGTALGLTIETGGKRGIRRQHALAEVQSREWQLAETMWTARAAVRTALLDRVFAERTVALDEEEADLRRAYLDWVDTKIEYGVGTVQDRLVAAEAVSRIESQLGLDLAALASAAASLAAEIGITTAALPQVHAPDLSTLPELAPEELDRARELALLNRLDVRRALADYEVAEQDVRAAVAEQYPNVALGPGYLFDQGQRKITLTPSVAVPLFHSGAAVIERAVADRTVAALRFDQTQADALAQIETSAALYRATRRALEAAEAGEQQASRTLDTVRRRLEAGAADRGDVLAAEIDLLLRRRNTLDARRTLIAAITGLEQGTQRPIFPPSSIAPSSIAPAGLAPSGLAPSGIGPAAAPAATPP